MTKGCGDWVLRLDSEAGLGELARFRDEIHPINGGALFQITDAVRDWLPWLSWVGRSDACWPRIRIVPCRSASNDSMAALSLQAATRRIEPEVEGRREYKHGRPSIFLRPAMSV